MKKILYILFLILISNNLFAQKNDGLDNRIITTYANKTEVARKTIVFRQEGNEPFTTVGKGNLHAYIDPLLVGNLNNCNFDKNYIRIFLPLADNKTTTVPIHNNINYDLWNETTIYFDEFGRKQQVVASKVSPEGRDMVMPVIYDNFGRVKEKLLPYYIAQKKEYEGAFRTNAVTEQETFYELLYNEGADAKSIKDFDGSPLNRVVSQVGAGQDFQDKPVRFEYCYNAENEVKNWSVDIHGNLIIDEFYLANTLYKNIIFDENNNETQIFKDKQGRIILKKENDGTNWLETYYVYDNYNFLRYIITPKAVAQLTARSATYVNPTATENPNLIISKLCFFYSYDNINRLLVTKKDPGVEPERMVYDNRNNLVYSQDGNLRAKNSWKFYKYDIFNRKIITGIRHFSNPVSINYLKNELENCNYKYETYDNITHSYSNNAKPDVSDANCEILTETYYDSYDYAVSQGYNETITAYGTASTTALKGISTCSKVKVLDDSNKYLHTVSYYDKYGRVIQISTENHIGGKDVISNRYNFTGQLLETKQEHCKSSNTITNTITQKVSYDRIGRITKNTHKIDENPEVTVSEHEYNELGQLKTKKLAGGIQNIDYSYNIKGWLTGINDPTNLGNDYFAMKLKYAEGNQFNGNISGMDWASKNFNQLKTYNFTYDGVNRLKIASYSDAEKYSTSYTYDENGNIELLTRKGKDGTSDNYTEIDRISYKYHGNQLHRANEVYPSDIHENNGFKDNGSFADNEFLYDANGNLIKDDNKPISNINYNYLNLATQITFQNDDNKIINYLYDAAGIKRQKNANGKQTDYIGNFVYENNELKYILFSEGRITFHSSLFTYNYNLTDHLGNIRVTFTQDGTISQEDSYYPFGMSIKSLSHTILADNQKNKYLYNGKELQEDFGLNWYDYGFRQYDPELARWHVKDAMASIYHSTSPYAYVRNNPISRTDFLGLWEDDDERGDVDDEGQGNGGVEGQPGLGDGDDEESQYDWGYDLDIENTFDQEMFDGMIGILLMITGMIMTRLIMKIIITLNKNGLQQKNWKEILHVRTVRLYYINS